MKRESGVTFIVLLIMLAVISLLSISSVRSTVLEEKMVGNMRDRDKAFQSAEAAVQVCLSLVNSKTFPAAQILAPVDADDVPPTQNWEVEATWTASGYEVNTGDGSLSSQPECLVEQFNANSFRVTGRAKGGRSTTAVVLQATYTLE